jgi:hypothetical protein
MLTIMRYIHDCCMMKDTHTTVSKGSAAQLHPPPHTTTIMLFRIAWRLFTADGKADPPPHTTTIMLFRMTWRLFTADAKKLTHHRMAWRLFTVAARI